MMLNLKMISDYSEEENIFTKYAQAKKRGDTAEAERLSKIIENDAQLAKLHCKREKVEQEEPNLTKQCGICGKPINNDLTFCSSSRGKRLNFNFLPSTEVSKSVIITCRFFGAKTFHSTFRQKGEKTSTKEIQIT